MSALDGGPGIRPYHRDDWPEVQRILEAALAGADSLAHAPGTAPEVLERAWVGQAEATFVACGPDGAVAGVYTLKPNQPGLGAHVCNCGYVVDPAARGRGLAEALCVHSQAQARSRGYRAMQFNFVVSTNEGAVRLWTRLGFETVGRLPGAFAHPTLGDVDALVMYKRLA